MLISYFSCQQQDQKQPEVAGATLDDRGREDQLVPGYSTGKSKPAHGGDKGNKRHLSQSGLGRACVWQ
ncbi:hypothetical protein llap_4229 [Limosa lapponica baueri]|uniref:Uncharacterized protein n=1 Tax=Limosa lapponica baueri TaxID=1758121 RepID=A0A2I0UHF2_LIMLA|nr:hypothetical protein llap_4229 [Limosa lapponica baueri]